MDFKRILDAKASCLANNYMHYVHAMVYSNEASLLAKSFKIRAAGA